MHKTALITGASSGIGLALGRIFAEEGFDLVVVARRAGKLEQIASEFRDKHNIGVTVMSKDLSDPAAPEEIYQALQAQGIAVDVLVNSAGYGTHGLFAGSDLPEELGMLQVNITSLVHLTRLLLPGMLERGYGRILNLGSTGSFAPTPRMSVYGGTKAFVLWFSEALGEELRGTPVRVTALCPGVTPTGFQQRANVKDVRLVTGPGRTSVEQVAREGFEALMRGRAVTVPGFLNRLMIFAVRFMPRSFVVRFSHQLMKPA